MRKSRKLCDKLFFARSAHFDTVAAYDDGRLFDCGDKREIDETVVVAFDETEIFQLVFGFFERLILSQYRIFRMVFAVVIVHFDVLNRLRTHFFIARIGVDEQVEFVVRLVRSLYRLREFERKIEILQRFYEIVECFHLIALNGVLTHTRNENQNDVRVDFAQTVGAGHTVHIRHFYIHKNDVVIAVVRVQKPDCIAETPYIESRAVFRRISRQIAF